MIPSRQIEPTFIPDDVQKFFDEYVGEVRAEKIIRRIWNRDHTIWRPDPTEIENRLGWLDLTETMPLALPEVRERVARLLAEGPLDVVLLGMGGSSLCPEVFRRTIGSKEGHPALHVLDTTVPEWVRRVTEEIDPAKTLFLVASKSGGTIEVMSAFKHFWDLASGLVEDPGSRFVAITDPGTGLAKMAEEHGFAETFLNPPDIGGRYSALSLFGLVPALLLGLDVEEMLSRAAVMAEACRSDIVDDNPGASLGLFLAASTAVGRDKLTLVIDPIYESLGLWIEQLIAESTGKEGKGILPIALEPLEYVAHYGYGRAFVVIAPSGKSSLPGRLDAMKAADYPVAVYRLKDPLDLGAEFFRWEFATALASHFLDIQPFDQPNVQEAKTLTGQVLAEFKGKGKLPEAPAGGSLQDLLSKAQSTDYLAILAYLAESPELEQALSDLRRTVMKRHRLATTVGYGPRYLHSTGQYHKGGPNTGLFLQLVQDYSAYPIPGEPYGFESLAAAQALGDFQALSAKGRRVVQLRLGSSPAEEIRALAEQVAGGR
ncbi:MAG: glucose-6-phosphate isomerase [Candidatus Omnitrophica bacterium]|nr:glucose-6-phosphate isomerase [Candidatus Omnitrophota bacterium]